MVWFWALSAALANIYFSEQLLSQSCHNLSMCWRSACSSFPALSKAKKTRESWSWNVELQLSPSLSCWRCLHWPNHHDHAGKQQVQYWPSFRGNLWPAWLCFCSLNVIKICHPEMTPNALGDASCPLSVTTCRKPDYQAFIVGIKLLNGKKDFFGFLQKYFLFAFGRWCLQWEQQFSRSTTLTALFKIHLNLIFLGLP